MLKEIYNLKREEIDNCIKDAIKSVENKLIKVDYSENIETIKNLEENYNIKLGAVCEALYIKGLKDGAKLKKEIEE